MSEKTKTYKLHAPHYRQGVYYEEGAVITVSADEKPSKTWEPIEELKSTKAPAPASSEKVGRAADRAI